MAQGSTRTICMTKKPPQQGGFLQEVSLLFVKIAKNTAAVVAFAFVERVFTGAGECYTKGEEHEYELKLMGLVESSTQAGEKDSDEHFDTEDNAQDAGKNTEDERETADHFEICDKNAGAAAKTHAGKHPFHFAKV